jgi:hypothetical protein
VNELIILKKQIAMYKNRGSGSSISAIIGDIIVDTEAERVNMPNNLAYILEGNFSIVRT